MPIPKHLRDDAIADMVAGRKSRSRREMSERALAAAITVCEAEFDDAVAIQFNFFTMNKRVAASSKPSQAAFESMQGRIVRTGTSTLIALGIGGATAEAIMAAIKTMVTPAKKE